MLSYTLLPYSEDNLSEVLSGKFTATGSTGFITLDEIKDKNLFAYLT